MKSFLYLGDHTDERAIPGVGHVKKGAVITSLGDEHTEAIKAAKDAEGNALFKVTATPKDADPMNPDVTVDSGPADLPDPQPVEIASNDTTRTATTKSRGK